MVNIHACTKIVCSYIAMRPAQGDGQTGVVMFTVSKIINGVRTNITLIRIM